MIILIIILIILIITISVSHNSKSYYCYKEYFVNSALENKLKPKAHEL